MSLLVSHENISSFTSDSVRRTQDMLSGSASFQMHPRNPFRNLLELFNWSPVTSIILLPTPSLLLISSLLPPSAYPSPSLLLLPPPLFSYSSPFSYPSPLLLSLPLPRDACQFFTPLLHSLSHRIHVTNLSGLWGRHYLLLCQKKTGPTLNQINGGKKKKASSQCPHWPWDWNILLINSHSNRLN